MTEAEEQEQVDLSAIEELAAHRYLRLLELGFPPDDALHLVRNRLLDWHEAERLLKNGCPRELVIRLLEE